MFQLVWRHPLSWRTHILNRLLMSTWSFRLTSGTHKRGVTTWAVPLRYEAFIRWSKLTTSFPGAELLFLVLSEFANSDRFYRNRVTKNLKSSSQSVDSEKSPHINPYVGIRPKRTFLLFRSCVFFGTVRNVIGSALCEVAGQFAKSNMGCKGYSLLERNDWDSVFLKQHVSSSCFSTPWLFGSGLFETPEIFHGNHAKNRSDVEWNGTLHFFL